MTNQERQKRYRARKRNGTVTESVTGGGQSVTPDSPSVTGSVTPSVTGVTWTRRLAEEALDPKFEAIYQQLATKKLEHAVTVGVWGPAVGELWEATHP